jgi:S-adenosylmethionine-dependent methyltransferase
MNDASHDGFDGAAAIFAEHAKTLRGYVRYQIVRRNLEPYLTGKNLNILDIGGGSGIDAAWLASQGHKVLLIEPSSEQFTYAERRFNFFLTADQRQRITLKQISLEEIPARQQFDVVLMHGVAMFQPEPTKFITSAFRFVKPGGLFSLVEKGYYGAEARAIREHRLKQVANLHATQHVVDNLKLSTYAFKPEEIEALLLKHDFEIIQWTGVRVIAHDMNLLVEDVDKDELATILETEFEQGADPGIRTQGQLLHFISRKPKA